MLFSTWLIWEALGVVASLIGALYIYYKLRIFNFWRKRGVVYVEPTFPIGNIMPLLTGNVSQAAFFKDIYEQYKKHRLVGVYMFYRPFLIVNDPDLIRDVLAKEFASFHDRGLYSNEEIDPLSGQLFQLPGKKWRNLRVKLTPTFTSGKIKQMFLILKDTGDSLCNYFQDKAQERAIIDIKDVFARFSVDVIMSVAFGINCDSLKNPDNEFRYWGKRIFVPKPLWNALVFWAPQVFDFFSIPYTEKEVTNFFINMFKDTVQYREKNNIVRKDFLNSLIQLMRDGYVDPDDFSENVKHQTEKKLTMTEAAAQAFIFYVAGFETSSTTATFCMFELAKHQGIQDKVRDEIHAVIQKHGGLSYTAVNDMTYLHKVVSETLRKYPPVAVLNRICTEEIQLDTTDFRIPKGTAVIIPVFGIHWDSNIYPNPEVFDPERFSEENIATRHSYVYLPFGEGPRVCIGLRFGLMQTKISIINALLKNKFRLAPNMPTTLEYEGDTLVLLAKGGVHLTVEPI